MPAAVKRYWLRCTADGALSLGARRSARAGSVGASLEYIPGSTLRGALAQLHQRWPERKQRWDLFLAGASFPDLTPAGARAVPLSARTCKYEGGFWIPLPKHGVYDSVLPLGDEDLVCDRCGAELKGHTGWMEDGYRGVRVAKAITGHTAIDIHTRTAAAGMLYMEETVAAPGGFAGELTVPESDAAFMEELLRDAKQAGLRIGHGVRKGMGWVDLDYGEGPLPGVEGPGAAVERLSGMQERLHAIRGRERDAAFSVTLRSRAILLDDHLRYRSTVDLADLEGWAEMPAGFDLTRRFTETEWVFGWNEAAGLPRSPDLAIRQGAAFLFERKGRPLEQAEIEKMAAGMDAIEAAGIGERRVEGFGRVVLCDRFHWRGEYERNAGEFTSAGEQYLLHYTRPVCPGGGGVGDAVHGRDEP